MRLYKFHSLADKSREFTLDIIRNNRLWCSYPEDLNDMFESKPIYVEACTTDDDIEFVRGLNDKPDLNRWYLDNIQNIVNFGKSLFEAHEAVAEEIVARHREMPKRLRICSFSQIFDSAALWGLYADSGSGIAIEYNVSDIDVEVDAKLLKVIYDAYRPKIFKKEIYKVLCGDEFYIQQLHRKMACYKSPEWSYEREVRYIEIQNKDYIENVVPSRILLGPKISKTDESALRKEFPSISFVQTKISDSEYSVVEVG